MIANRERHAAGGRRHASSLSFRLLGPIEVAREGRPIELGSAKVRALLALLVLRANELVPREVMIDKLWGGDPPAAANHSVSVYVSQLRKALRESCQPQIIFTRANGYLLDVEPEAIDLRRFESLTDAGRDALASGRPAEAADLFRAGLDLWRGAALADLADEPFAEAEGRWLNELRLTAFEEWIGAELEIGHNAQLIPQLEALVAENPLREPLVGQLMLALYRSGRQADALAAYSAARTRLVDELGIEPHVPLQSLQHDILRHSPEIECAEAPDAASAAPVTRSRPPPHRRWRWLALSLLASAAVAVVVGTALPRGKGTAAALIGGNAIAWIDAGTGSLTKSTHVSPTPGPVAIADDELWFVRPEQGSVVRVGRDGAVRQEVKVGADAEGLAIGAGAVWVTSPADGTVSRIDMRTGQVVDQIRTGNAPAAIAYGDGSIWVANQDDRTVSRIDPHSGVVSAPIDTDAAGDGIAVGPGAVWVSDGSDSRVAEIDPSSDSVVRTVTVGNGPGALAASGRTVWVANRLDGTLSRIDAHDGVVRQTVPVGSEPIGVTITPRGVWVASHISATLDRIDPVSGAVTRRIALGGEPEGLESRGALVAVTVGFGRHAHRGGVLRAVLPSASVSTVDPALVTTRDETMLLSTTGDGLVAVRREGGTKGAHLVPDLAVALPSAMNAGTVYTFRLRPGIHYSTGAVVRPSDVRFSIERLFRRRSPRMDLYTGIVGARVCLVEIVCHLRSGIVADDRRGIVSFRLLEPDPDFLEKLALPYAYVLPHPGLRPGGLPSTGPYQVRRFVPGHLLVLARNPRFKGWSVAARPAGYVDRITVRLVDDTSRTAERAIRDVVAGKTDFVQMSSLSARNLSARVSDPTRLHAWPTPTTTYLLLNTGLPPFDSLAARQALDYAIDRTTTTASGRPTCQILPPGFPSYRRYCPFTVSSGRGWIAPDIAAARRLVDRSGTRGARVTLWLPAAPGVRQPTRAAATALRRLGYRVVVRPATDEQYGALFLEPKRAQLLVASWTADYLSPANFFANLFRCGTAAGSLFPCDEKVSRVVDRALREDSTDPVTAAARWTALDRLVTSRALVVPIRNPLLWTLVSKRVGDYDANPMTGPMLDQLWVR